MIAGVAQRAPSARLLASACVVLMIPVLVNFFDGEVYSWAISDLHINYAAGFVRRGFLGELAVLAEAYFAVSPSHLFKALFLAAYTCQIVLLYRLLWPWREVDVIVLITALSPVLMLFPQLSEGAYMRKEVFIALAILLHANAWRLEPQCYQRFLRHVLAPYLIVSTLIYEVQFFFVGFHVAAASGKGLSVRNAVFLGIIPCLIFIAGFLVPVSADDARKICFSWSLPVTCVAVEALQWPYRTFIELNGYYVQRPQTLIMMVALLVAATVPALLVVAHADHGARTIRGATKTAGAVAAMLLIPLFVVGYDWGRWIHLWSIHCVALALLAKPDFGHVHAASNLKFWQIVAIAVYVACWQLPSAGALDNQIFEGSLVGRLAKSIALRIY